MIRKEQIAKKAARAAALATYKTIMNPPVWKVAGASFTTSPTWEDIAKAAAAASYGAVLKLAQDMPKAEPVTPLRPDAEPINPNIPNFDLGKPPAPWVAPKPTPNKDPIFGDGAKADDGDLPPDLSKELGVPKPFEAPKPNPKKDPIFGTASARSAQKLAKLASVMMQIPIDFGNLGVLKNIAPEFLNWAAAGGKGPMPADIQKLVAYIKSDIPGKVNWANPERWSEIVAAIASQISQTNPQALAQIANMM